MKVFVQRILGLKILNLENVSVIGNISIADVITDYKLSYKYLLTCVYIIIQLPVDRCLYYHTSTC